MASHVGNPLNVYTGPDAVAQYYNPDLGPPVPLVEIPDKLNPYRKDGVRIYAKIMSCLPANNVKSLPGKALNMLEKCVKPNDTKTIIEYSSGSTVVSMSLIARAIHGVDDVRAFLSNKTTDAKLNMMRFFGLRITLFGGPSQPEPADPRGGIHRAQQMAAERDDTVNPNQYENIDNPKAHSRWTGPQLLKQLPHLNVLAAGLGTSGTLTGIGTYLKATKPSVHIVGVCTAPGDRVPGPRSHALLAPVQFPWKSSLDSLEEVGSYDSFSLSMALSREGLIVGPSSGFNLKGLFQFLEKRKQSNTLQDLAGEDGEIHCVFICCDLPYQYLNEYFTILGESAFHPIENEELKSVDLWRYDEAWELPLPAAVEKWYTELDTDYDSGLSDSDTSTPDSEKSESETTSFPKPRRQTVQIPSSSTHQLQRNTVLLDLRPQAEFQEWHLPGSCNFPLESFNDPMPTATESPFKDPKILAMRWRELEEVFNPNASARTPYSAALVAGLKSCSVGLVCRDGDTARVATSVLRAKGVEAWSLKGGAWGVGK
ncbi:cysteine synthase B [Ascodesmis nigricans]|uniref:Cysteine synthase B n=1 Tax=Ascodesmis nigricans TaxID=341454 RepID=A0A4S2MVN0_9PEZI|nr:cysteine synthase B [Ascodesmis nigricans]